MNTMKENKVKEDMPRPERIPGWNIGAFKKELEHLINRYSMENRSDTPDYMLAEYLVDCLKNYSRIVKQRDKWFNFSPFKDKQIALKE